MYSDNFKSENTEKDYLHIKISNRIVRGVGLPSSNKHMGRLSREV